MTAKSGKLASRLFGRRSAEQQMKSRNVVFGVIVPCWFSSYVCAQEDCSEWDARNWFSEVTIEAVTACLGAGLDVTERRTNSGYTPLHWAARFSDDSAIIRVIVESGGDVNARSISGETPLHWAVQCNENPIIVDALIDSGANPNAVARTRDGIVIVPFEQAKFNAGLRGSSALKRLNDAYWPLEDARYWGQPVEPDSTSALDDQGQETSGSPNLGQPWLP